MRSIDTLAYTNRLRHLPPEHKLLLAAVLLCITYFSQVPVQLLITAWMTVWTVLYAGVPTKLYVRLILITIGFWLMSVPALVIGIVSLNHLPSIQLDSWSGFVWNGYYIYLSQYGIHQAIELAVRAIAATSCIYFVMLTVPFIEIIHILNRVGCPALITELLMLMYRFIFVLFQTANQLWIAQQARGGYRTRQRWICSLGLLVGQLLHLTLDNFRRFSLTLETRGFTGEFRVLHSRQYVSSKRYSLEALFGCAVLLTVSGCQYVKLV